MMKNPAAVSFPCALDAIVRSPAAESPLRLPRRLRLRILKLMWLAQITVPDAAKRGLDVVVSLCALLALMPVFVVVALLVKITDGGPVLFCQRRVGRWGQVFLFPKFRSMVPNAEKMREALLEQNDHKEGVTFKMKCDPRVTWIGRILRKFSIDELPQLWCVLTGDMTLVGPRPPLPDEVARYTQADRRRLDAVPGLTCFWQVSGRGNLPFSRQLELDVQYIESRSFWLDLKLLGLTLPAVVRGNGAY